MRALTDHTIRRISLPNCKLPAKTYNINPSYQESLCKTWLTLEDAEYTSVFEREQNTI